MNRASTVQMGFTVFAICLATSPILGQTEGDLKKAFEGKMVAPKMALPGSSDGVKINLKNQQPRDFKAELKNLDKFTTAIAAEQPVMISQVIAKGDTIEFLFGKGGVGRVWCGGAAGDIAERSQREIDLDLKFNKTSAESAELAKLVKERKAEEEKLDTKAGEDQKACQEQGQKKRKEGGSRLIVQYRSKLTAADLTPDAVRKVMAEYIEFAPTSRVPDSSVITRVQPTREQEDAAKKQVVMIKGTIDGDETVGAGLIVGAAQDRLYIVTANHVVRKGPKASRDLQAMVRWLNGSWFKAELLTTMDAKSDLAVITVSDLRKLQVNPSAFAFGRLGVTPQRAARVRFVGYGNTQPWHEAVDPAPVSLVSSEAIKFQSAFLVPGDSGGVLFNEQWQVVGINQSDQQGEAQALPFSRVMEKLQEWGHPVSLK